MSVGWVERAQGLRWRLAAAALSGALFVAAFPAFEQRYLAWICLVPVLWALDDDEATAPEALLIGLAFGVVAQLGAMGWVYHAYRHGAALAAGGALTAYLVLCALQGTAGAAWAVGVQRLRRLGVPLVLAAPVLLVLVEWLYPALFPTYLASSQYRSRSLIQVVDLTGPLGLSFVLALSSAVLYTALARPFGRQHRMVGAAALGLAALVSAVLVYGATVVRDVEDTVDHPARELRIGVIQPGLVRTRVPDPVEKLRREREQSLEVVRQSVDLVIWPEGSYDEVIRDGTGNVARTGLGALGRPLLFGGLRHERVESGRRRLFSTAFLASPDGTLVAAYDRHYLLAFKDQVPLGSLFPWLYEVLPHGVLLDSGAHRSRLDVAGVRVGVVMSYEELLPGYVREVMADGPELLVSLSDGWLAQGRGPRVQLALATFRAVEHRRFFVRATPAGVSAVIDPTGAVVADTTLGARANLVADVGALSGWTVYELLGDWPGYVCLAALAAWLRPAVVAWARRRRQRPVGTAPAPTP